MRLISHNGQTAEFYSYDEFRADLLGNQGQFQPFGYTGYQKDDIAGTYYAQAREYDARTGRFTSEDVIKGSIYFPVSLNWYLYCQNQPIDYIDLNGLSREDARKYMEEYQWDEKEKRNPDYPSFRTNCANYVSQSLVAGGVAPVTYEWFCSEKVNASEIEKWVLKIGSKEHQMAGHNVYYNDTDKGHDVLLSDTWNNANAQYKYFANPHNGYSNGDVIKAGSSKEIKEILRNYDIQTGDLVYWSEKGDGYANRATIISKVDENFIYYAGNTSKKFDERITNDKFKRYKCIYIVRLKDEVFDNDCLE